MAGHDSGDGCPFCDWDALNGPVRLNNWAYTVVPRDPVTDGHRLVIPHTHVPDAVTDPRVTGEVFSAAAAYAKQLGGQWNFITSVGPAATQTVQHLHVHLVPRRAGDGLALPWERDLWELRAEENRRSALRWLAELNDARTRLAEVEADRQWAYSEVKRLGTRLAAVEAECKDAGQFDTRRDFVKHVLAVARGEEPR